MLVQIWWKKVWLPDQLHWWSTLLAYHLALFSSIPWPLLSPLTSTRSFGRFFGLMTSDNLRPLTFSYIIDYWFKYNIHTTFYTLFLDIPPHPVDLWSHLISWRFSLRLTNSLLLSSKHERHIHNLHWPSAGQHHIALYILIPNYLLQIIWAVDRISMLGELVPTALALIDWHANISYPVQAVVSNFYQL